MEIDGGYKVGDLSSLLGFDDVQPESNLFDRPAAQAIVAPKDKHQEKLSSIPTQKRKKRKKQSSDLTTKTLQTSPNESEGTSAEPSSSAAVIVNGVDDDTPLIATSRISPSSSSVSSVKKEGSEKREEPESKNARKRRKRRENALVVKREADIFDGEEPGKKKRKKEKKEEDSDDSEKDLDEEDIRKAEMEKKKMEKKKKEATVRDPKDDDRTVFVGNIPKTTRKKHLVQLFSAVGKVVTLRIRGAVSSDPKQSKRVAAITNNIHAKLDSLFAYVVFESALSVPKAVAQMNGTEFQGRHLRVDVCQPGGTSCNDKLSIFVGNLPYDVTEESLRKLFNEECGDVTRIRVVRDKTTRMGKGFGYVEFRSMGAVKDATTKSEQLTLDGRSLRIRPATLYGKNTKGQTKTFMGNPSKRKGMAKPSFKKKGKGMKTFGKKKDLVKL